MKELNEIIEYLKIAIEEATLGNFVKNNISDDSLLMDEIGLDSLDYASIMLAGETFVGRKINENDVVWRDIKSVKQLAELIYRAQNG